MLKHFDIFSLKTVKVLLLLMFCLCLNVGNVYATPCGTAHPDGCPEGMVCEKHEEKVKWGTGSDYTITTTYKCVKAEDANEKNVVEGGNNSWGTGLAEAPEFAPKTSYVTECPMVTELRAKYQSGCWSCLVVEKLTSAFLSAAEKAYELAQRAGLIVLFVGALMWVLVWGLKNMSSLTQLEPGNILNDLIKFGFKIMLAYVFITSGLRVVRDFFITPLMGTGAIIAQQFWPDDIAKETQNFVWEDELVSPTQQAIINHNVAQSNQTAQTQQSESTPVQVSQEAQAVTPLKLPQIVDSSTSPNEQIVQQFQKAYLQVLNQRYQSIKSSCTSGDCSKSCRYSSCRDAGHMAAVKDIHQAAGSSGGGNTAYCQAAITASLNDLNKMVGGDIVSFQNGIVNCGVSINNAAQNYPGSVTASASGGDIKLSEALQRANIGDMIYIRVGTSVTSSGYHAVTYLGNGRVMSFNGDSIWTITNEVGKIVSTSEIIRQEIANHPEKLNNVDMDKLNELAEGQGDLTLINYTGGTYAPASHVSTLSGGTSSAVQIGDISYTGPTDIMPASIMNSILGATKAITDTTAETMVLGDAVQCYAGLEKGGAWNVTVLGLNVSRITNFWMWLEGTFIWCTGFLLTLAIAYYLLDIGFKIGFAVIALPIVVGLWPFNMTKGKFTNCLSIIFKASATFAFLAITTAYSLALINSALGGLENIYDVMDSVASGQEVNQEQTDYVARQLELFSANYIILVFAFLYSYKLVGSTVSSLVNKFFPDQMFGEAQPIHHWSTAASRWVKDQAMKPIGYGRDIAMYQGGRAIKGAATRTVSALGGLIRGKRQNGPGGGGGPATTAARGAQAAAKAGEMAGEGVKQTGKAIGAASKAANAIPVAGQAISIAGGAVGKAMEAGGEAVKQTSKAVGKAAEQAEKAAQQVDKGLQKATETASGGKADHASEGKKSGGDDDKNLLG